MALKAKDPKQAKLRKPRILVFGPAGVGKTWVGIEFPAVYYIDCEGGAALPHYTDKLSKAGGVYLGPEDGANDMDVIVEQIRSLGTQRHPYKTVVLDSYSKLFNTAIQIEGDRMKSEGRDMTKTFGAEKKPAIAATRQIILWLEKMDMNVIFVCHQKPKWEDGEKTGDTFDGWDKLEYELDLVLQVVKLGKARKARVCKCRLSQFKEGELIPWSYAAFAERYGADVMESEATYLEPSTAEQVQLVNDLASVVRLEDKDRIKWWDKAGVNSWAEMDKETLAKCIQFLQSRIPN